MMTSEVVRETTVQYLYKGKWKKLNVCFSSASPERTHFLEKIIIATWVCIVISCAVLVTARDWFLGNTGYKIFAAITVTLLVIVNAYITYKIKNSMNSVKKMPRDGWEINNEEWGIALEKVSRLIIVDGKRGDAAIAAGTMVVDSLCRGVISVSDAYEVEEFVDSIINTVSLVTRTKREHYTHNTYNAANIHNSDYIKRLE